MPSDDASGPNSETTINMAAKISVTESTLNPNAPFFFPAAFTQIEDFSAEWWTLVHSTPAFQEYWTRERMQYVDGEELSAEDVDHLETMIDFIDQPDATGDGSENFSEEFQCGNALSNFVSPSTSVDKENLQEHELVRSVKQLDIRAHIPPPHQKEHNVYHDKLAFSPSKIPSFPRRSAMHRVQQPR